MKEICQLLSFRVLRKPPETLARPPPHTHTHLSHLFVVMVPEVQEVFRRSVLLRVEAVCWIYRQRKTMEWCLWWPEGNISVFLSLLNVETASTGSSPSTRQPMISARRQTVPLGYQVWGLMRMKRATVGTGRSPSTGISGFWFPSKICGIQPETAKNYIPCWRLLLFCTNEKALVHVCYISWHWCWAKGGQGRKLGTGTGKIWL